MADSYTPNKGLILMQSGNDVGTWGTNLNNALISILDNNLGGDLTKSVAGAVDVTLSSSESENVYYSFTGALTGNINVIWPTGAGFYIVTNNTTGAYTLSVKPLGGTSVGIAQGATAFVFISTNTGAALLISTTGAAGALAIVNGGTGQTTQQAAINALVGAVTSGQYLRGNGTNVLLAAIQATDVPTLNQNTTGTAATVTGATQAAITSAANLATVGTIGTGIWQGTAVAATYGGTGADTHASSGVAQVSSGTWSVSTALANGTTATTQSSSDNSTKVATTAQVQAAITANGGVGAGQTWTDETSSRTLGTTYTNSSGKPIEVIVVTSTTSGVTTSVTVGGVTIASSGFSSGSGTRTQSLSFIVPNGTNYSATGGSLSTWCELR